jgi:hypothetical protein
VEVGWIELGFAKSKFDLSKNLRHVFDLWYVIAFFLTMSLAF